MEEYMTRRENIRDFGAGAKKFLVLGGRFFFATVSFLPEIVKDFWEERSEAYQLGEVSCGLVSTFTGAIIAFQYGIPLLDSHPEVLGAPIMANIFYVFHRLHKDKKEKNLEAIANGI